MPKVRLFIALHEFPHEWPTGVYAQFIEDTSKDNVITYHERNDAAITVLSEYELKKLWKMYQEYKKGKAKEWIRISWGRSERNQQTITNEEDEYEELFTEDE